MVLRSMAMCAARSSSAVDSSFEPRTVGLTAESVDARALVGVLPEVGQVEVIRLSADFLS